MSTMDLIERKRLQEKDRKAHEEEQMRQKSEDNIKKAQLYQDKQSKAKVDLNMRINS